MRISSWLSDSKIEKLTNVSRAIANFPKVCTNSPLVALTLDAL